MPRAFAHVLILPGGFEAGTASACRSAGLLAEPAKRSPLDFVSCGFYPKVR
jgi:hypothetical protein